jgi:phage-related protein
MVMDREEKPLAWEGSSYQDLRRFSRPARRMAGYELDQAVYVLHAFQKTTQKTRRHDIEVARQRYAEVARSRGDRKRVGK